MLKKVENKIKKHYKVLDSFQQQPAADNMLFQDRRIHIV